MACRKRDLLLHDANKEIIVATLKHCVTLLITQTDFIVVKLDIFILQCLLHERFQLVSVHLLRLDYHVKLFKAEVNKPDKLPKKVVVMVFDVE